MRAEFACILRYSILSYQTQVITAEPNLTATREEIEKLKSFVKQIPRAEIRSPGPAAVVENSVEAKVKLGNKVKYQEFSVGSLFRGGIQNVTITREPLAIDNPVMWLKLVKPEFQLYRWQIETLMQIGGYLTVGKYGPGDKTEITDKNPFLFVGPMANGSGKDMVVIAAAATWLVVSGLRNRVVITSSSHKQIKDQTEPHIRDLINCANKKFNQIFKSTQFHHIVPELGGEIILFVTDEAGKAEGYHPYDIGSVSAQVRQNSGKMMIVKNESKSIPEDINDALLRCTGYSHVIEISSPGPRSGFMYKHVENAVQYPAPVELGRYYFRKVTAFDCPHLGATHAERAAYEKGIDSPWYKSSILAEFSDVDSTVVITEYEYERCFNLKVTRRGDDIGIGLDIAAGGDENACFVRHGNHVVSQFFFRQYDTDLAALLIDRNLLPWKNQPYTFRADNGGVGMGVIDKLRALGWNVTRTNNQSPASNKREFLNLGAEMWFHTKRLIARNDIILPTVDKLKQQLTSRWYMGMDTTQGKLQLESKQHAKAAGRPSPDRADAFVLCFYSYRPNNVATAKPARDLITAEELLRREHIGAKRIFEPIAVTPGRFSWIGSKI